jgi:hypothetical protein
LRLALSYVSLWFRLYINEESLFMRTLIFASTIAVVGSTASAVTYDQSVFCNGLSELANGNKQIVVPVADAQVRPIYLAAGLESRLDSSMYQAITTGQGDLSPFNEWLGAECNGLALISQ